jgi:hypothetical protein
MYIFQYVFLTNTQTLNTRSPQTLLRDDVLSYKTLLWSESPFNKSGQETQKTSRPKQTNRDTHTHTHIYIYAESQTEKPAGRPKKNRLLIAE